MPKDDIVIIADYSQTSSLSIKELCEICQTTLDFVDQLSAYDIIHPEGETPEEWKFNLAELRRIQTALRLQRDLELNLAGIALVFDLLEELEKLKAHKELLEKHFSKL